MGFLPAWWLFPRLGSPNTLVSLQIIEIVHLLPRLGFPRERELDRSRVFVMTQPRKSPSRTVYALFQISHKLSWAQGKEEETLLLEEMWQSYSRAGRIGSIDVTFGGEIPSVTAMTVYSSYRQGSWAGTQRAPRPGLRLPLCAHSCAFQGLPAIPRDSGLHFSPPSSPDFVLAFSCSSCSPAASQSMLFTLLPSGYSSF